MANGGARPGAGRKKGVPNKDKRALMDRIEALYPGYHPVIAMAAIANDESGDVDLAMRFQAHKEVAQYVEPKRKAIEHSGEGGGPLTVQIVRFADTDPE